MRHRLYLLPLLLLLPGLWGCSGMKIAEFTDREPALVLEDYFDGRVYAWGIFEDRFGRLRREFQVEIDGRWDGQELVLDEHFLYSDGETDRRIWRIRADGDGRYQGKADDILGVASGELRGNALNWRYKMDLKVGEGSWRVSFDDWMFLQPGGVMINRATVRKWGLELGTVTLFFARAEVFAEAPFALIEK